MRYVLLLSLVACGGRTPVGAEPTPEPPAAEPEGSPPEGEAVEAPDTSAEAMGAAVLAAGGCAQTTFADGEVPQVALQPVGDADYWVVTCESYAYQGQFEIWSADGPTPVRSGDGVLGGLGMPTVHASRRQVSWFSKAAGAGQCGDYFVYGLDGALQEHRSRSCSAPGEVPPADEWPQIGPSPVGTVTSVQNGDVSCYLALTHADGSEMTYPASFEVCNDSFVGKHVTLEMGLGTVMGDSCEGDPECDDSVEIALATAVNETPAP